MARRWRVFHADFPQAAGASLRLSPSESHHIRRVLRLRVGESLALFDGRGIEWSATITTVGEGAITVELLRPLEGAVESPLDVHVYQGLCRPEKMDQVVQKLTEVGVVAIHLLGCRNAERFPPDAKRLERWQRIAIEACKQSGRRRVPSLEPATCLPEAGATLSWLLDTSPDAVPLAEALARSGSQPCRIAVGPESGLVDAEVEQAVAAGWQPVSLGPRVLRTETAGLAAACAVLHVWGDLGR